MPHISRTSPLPPLYYYFFAVVEPTLALFGGIYCLFFPEHYFDNTLHYKDYFLVGPEGGGLRGQIVTRGLGNCFFLLSLISFFLFPTLNSNLRRFPAQYENILVAFFLCLALGDITHVISTLYPVPKEIRSFPLTKWTGLLWANVGITAVLFAVRCMWFVGVNRPMYGLESEKKKLYKKEEEAPLYRAVHPNEGMMKEPEEEEKMPMLSREKSA